MSLKYDLFILHGKVTSFLPRTLSIALPFLRFFFLHPTLIISVIYPKVLILSEASKPCKFAYLNINLKCSWLIYISLCTVTKSYIIFSEILSTLHKTYITFFGLTVRQNYASFLISETLFRKVQLRA